MYEIVREQLAIDYNCKADDFLKDGIVFTKAEKLSSRRALPFLNTRCEMITMGKSVIINASKDVMPFVKWKLKNKSKYDVLNMPFVYGLCLYYLPDIEKVARFVNNTNLASQKTAIASGYIPAWNHCFKSRLYGKPFTFLNYIRF